MPTRLTFVCLAASLLGLLAASPVFANDIFLNGTKVVDLKNVELENCSVKFDALGNLQILSPGYRVVTDKDGKVRVVGSSDLSDAKSARAGKLAMRYVLQYTPNPKVNFQFEVLVNGKSFRKIGLETGAFAVEVTQELVAGANAIRVVGRPGDANPNGQESDIAALKIFKGSENADGVFVAKPPAVWELVRSSIDRDPLDRLYNVFAE